MTQKRGRKSQLHKIGFVLVAGAVVCGIVAFERYSRARRTAETVADSLGLDLVSFAIPALTMGMTFVGVVLMVAGVRCLYLAKSAD
jgi:hypothetical protein